MAYPTAQLALRRPGWKDSLTVSLVDGAAASKTDRALRLQGLVGCCCSTAGDGLDTKVRTADSDSAGLVQFTNLIRGASYQIWRSTFTSSSVFGSVATANAKVTFTVPDAASFDLPEVLGVDE